MITKTESRANLLAALPPEPIEAELLLQIRQQLKKSGRKLVVIDDDPTGVQTVHDIDLLLNWDVTTLVENLKQAKDLFFILTNSRSLPEAEAERLNRELAGQLLAASKASGIDFVIASRSDSTLRGHYPAEIQALEQALGQSFDGHLLIPAFFEGGRVTINDVHYVATPNATADTLLPADQTAFAQDKVFGYKTAYLPAWVAEKSKGYWQAAQVVSLDLELIRQGGVAAVTEKLKQVSGGVPIIVNAAGYGDLAVVVLGLLAAEEAGKRFLYRTAAGFVRVRGGVSAQPLLTAPQIYANKAVDSAKGGLVVVGSYVAGSSAQLEKLLALPAAEALELPVEQILVSENNAQAVSRATGQKAEAIIQSGKVAVLYTSRQLVTGTDEAQNLAIGRKVSNALLGAITEISTQPRFIIAKGGITSHDVAQKGLGASRALAIGQILPGVPVWQLVSGANLRFANVPYIVFPGNVGTAESLAEVVTTLL